MDDMAHDMANRHDDELDGIKHTWAGRALSTGKVAASAARLAGRRLIGARGKTDEQLGLKLARELDQMKGMAMKVGQILSYFDGALPEETHQALRVLQQGARPVALDVMVAVIESSFGRPLSELFDEFQPTPVAAASIGQVYRARYLGRDVAVKVQYPNVRDTLEADMSRLRSLSRLASLATAVDGPAIADELRARVLEECDYQHEARCQELFRTAWADDHELQIPAIVEARSSATVLTSSWHEGRDFYRFIEAGDQARRNQVGLTIARFAYHSLYQLGVINADPHPGNYLFPESGPLVFLDFGCVRFFQPAFLDPERALARVVIDDRRDRFKDALLATGMVAKPKRFSYDTHWDMLCHLYAPYRAPRFQFTSEYVRAGMRFNGPGNPNLRCLAIPPPWIWLQRLQWGLHAVLARLGAEGAFGDILRQAL